MAPARPEQPVSGSAARTGSLERITAYYDAAPYPSTASYPTTQPTRLAAVATMLGLRPPPVAGARVLELGCASGGNLIPLAARFPGMRCTGVDLSGVQIGRGQQRVRRAGLTNIELRQQDIADIDGAERYDYIICHGVYSWVPERVRDAVLSVISGCLADDGVAVVSYNVLPGWHSKLMLRESLLPYTAGIEDPVEKASMARRLVGLLKDHAPETAYGDALFAESERVDELPDDYLLHDLLEPYNAPCTVTDFVSAVERHGLCYLAEVHVHTMLAEAYGTETGRALREWSRGGRLALEQSIDAVTGRTLRQSVLVHPAQARTARHALGPECLRQLHFSGRFEPVDRDDNGAFGFRGDSDRVVTTTDPALAAALAALSARFPATAELGELIAITQDAGGQGAVGERVLLDALFRMVAADLVDLGSEPIRVGDPGAVLPVASALARTDLAMGASHTTNLRHESVAIEPMDQLLLHLLDGSHDRQRLRDAVLDQLQNGMGVLQRDGAEVTSDRDRHDGAHAVVHTILSSLHARALLVP